MVVSGFSRGVVFADIIQDWFTFLGGKPGEVVVVDSGSDLATQAIYWQLFQNKVIDKLHIVRGQHDSGDRNQADRQDYMAVAISNKPYVLLFGLDTIPQRQGYDYWFDEAINNLDRDGVFAVSAAEKNLTKHSDAWDHWYYSTDSNPAFMVLKRSMFMAAHHEFASNFILSGFKGDNPATAINPERSFRDVAFAQYCKTHNLLTLCRATTPDWQPFLARPADDRLQQIGNTRAS